jgi:hypothetical protein
LTGFLAAALAEKDAEIKRLHNLVEQMRKEAEEQKKIDAKKTAETKTPDRIINK